MKLPRIALLTDLSEEIGTSSLSNTAVFTHEVAMALQESMQHVGGIAVDIFARRNSMVGLPTVSLDPNEFAAPSHPLREFSTQEALYLQLSLSGMLNQYHLIHCLAPVVAPLVLLGNRGVPILHTITSVRSHPSVALPPAVLGNQIKQVAIGPYNGANDNYAIPPSVDLKRFRPAENPDDNFVLWLGRSEYAYATGSKAIAEALDLPLKTLESGDPSQLIRHARLLLHLPDVHGPCESIWPLRALACGTPVAGWVNDQLKALLYRPDSGALTTLRNVDDLIQCIGSISKREDATAARREFVLGLFNRRLVAARYRDLYKSFLGDL